MPGYLSGVIMSAGPDDMRVSGGRNAVRLDELFRREAPGLLSYFRRKTGDQDVARDLVQDSFVQITKAAVSTDLINPAAYLQRIARNLLFSRFRAGSDALDRGHVPLDEEWDVAIPPRQEEGLQAQQLLALYEAAVAGLSPKTRDIFLMSRRDGLTYKQIQDRVGVSMGTVEYHMMRAIAHIDRYLDEYQTDGC